MLLEPDGFDGAISRATHLGYQYAGCWQHTYRSVADQEIDLQAAINAVSDVVSPNGVARAPRLGRSTHQQYAQPLPSCLREQLKTVDMDRAWAAYEQLSDARAGAAVEEIVELLRDRTRPPLRTPELGEERTA